MLRGVTYGSSLMRAIPDDEGFWARRRHLVAGELERGHLDVVLLQECLPEQACELGAALGFSAFHAVVRGRPRQRAVLVAPGWSVGELLPIEILCAYVRPKSPRFAR